ncbi:adenylate kinase-domain-containing protein [Melampsora americana]|nr:adenylate kinase-domain-containing protein [Melampsora americana]KAH9818375.1 adenylate kinase-domain-containing protein [Melampsora americana]
MTARPTRDRGMNHSHSPPALSKPSFDSNEIVIVFVLGGPGAGKGTQCAKLVSDYGFIHLSAGDLLRAEQKREGSEFGILIQNHIQEGKIVPMTITVKLMENAIRNAIESEKKSKLFLIDGFPRQMDQAIKFDSDVCESSFVLFLTCPEEKLLPRLIERGKTSGREDDNEESIKKRFRTFVETSMPVVNYYREKEKVVEVDSSGTVDQIYSDICDGIKSRLPNLKLTTTDV